MRRITRLLSALLVLALVGVVGAPTANAGLLNVKVNLLSGATQTLTNTVEQVTQPLATTVQETTAAVSETVDETLTPVVGEQTADQLNVLPTEGIDPLTPVTDVLTGESGLPSAIQQLACPLVSEVAELLGPGLSEVGEGLTSIACVVGVLEYKFFTRAPAQGGGYVERTHVATLGVPQPLDVDGDTLPDLVGTITLTGLNTIGLQVDRLPTEVAPLPVSVEAILRDPTGGALGREHISIGYDALHDRAPGSFQLDTPLNTILRPSPEFDIDITQTGRGDEIALIGGLFDGTIQQRLNPTDLRLAWGASPDNAAINAKFGGDVDATLHTNRVGPADLSGRITNGVRQDRFHADFEDLPNTVGLNLSTDDGLDAVYTASQRVAQLDATFESVTRVGAADQIDQKAVLRLTDVPTGLTAHQEGNGGSVVTSGGPLGLAEIGIADGEPRFLTGEPAYVSLEEDADLTSVSARIPGIERVSFNVADEAVSASAKIQATPFLARLKDPGSTLSARVEQLPSEFDLGVDLNAGTLTYDGHGSGIDTIEIDGDGTDPIIGRATKLRGTISGIPALLAATLSFEDGSGGIEVTSPDPIGGVELFASNGPEGLPAGSDQGVVYHDVPSGEYLVAARIFDLKKIAFTNGDTAQLQAITRGGPFTLDVLTGDIDADGLVEDLPADTTIGVDLDGGSFTFRGKNAAGDPQGIDRLTLNARSLNGTFFNQADRLRALIQGIPAELDLTLTPDGDRMGVDASNPIGSIELVAANRDIVFADDLPADGNQGVHFIDKAGEFVLGARVLQLKSISALIGDTIELDAETAGGLFVADVALDSLTGTARIEDLPAKTHVEADLDAGHFEFQGRNADDSPAGIQELLLDVDSVDPLIGRADQIHARLLGIPSDLSFDFAQDGDAFQVDANEGIDVIEVVAANRAPDAGDLPVDGEQGAKYTDLTGGEFVIAARIRELTKLRAETGSPLGLTLHTAGGPFGVRVTTDDLSALARIQDLPSELDATLDIDAGRLTIDGHGQDIGLVTAEAVAANELFGRATNLAARVEGIPSQLTVDIAQDGNGARVESNAPIGKIEVAAANRPVDLVADLPVNDEQGARYTDLDGGEYVVGARVRQLQKIAASFTGTTAQISTKTEGGPFGVRVITDELNALARIENLPEQLDASIDLEAGRITIDGHGSGIDRLLFNASSTEALFAQAKHLFAEIRGIPASLTLDLTQTANGASLESSEPIGSIEVVADDVPITDPAALLPADDEQGVIYKDTTGDFLIAARVRELKKLVASLGDNDVVTLQALTQGGPFGVLAITNDLRANARFEDLPADVDVSFAPADGRFEYHGKNAAGDPQGVNLVTVDVVGDGIFGRANRLSARIEDLAADVEFTIDPAGPTASVLTSDPITKLEFLATDIPEGDPVPDLPADEQGAIYHDKTGQPFVLRARLLDLKQITFGLSDTGVELVSRLRHTPFGIDLQTDALDADARVDKLPASTNLTVDLESGLVQFRGFEADGTTPTGVDDLRITATSPDPLFGRATRVFAHIADVPSALDVQLSQTNGEATIEANDPIGLIEVLATEGSSAFPAPLDNPAAQGAVYHDRPSTPFVLAARVLQLTKLHVGFTLQLGLEARTAGGPFHVDVDTESFGAQAELLDLPANAKLSVDLETGTVRFEGSDSNGDPKGIDELNLVGRLSTPILGGANRLKVHIEELPSLVELGFSQADGNARLHANEPIKLIEIKGWAEGDPEPDFPADQGVILHNKPDQPFKLAARVRELEDIDIQFGEAVNLHTKTAGGLFTADIVSETLNADAEIDQLPEEFDIALDLENGQATFDGHGQAIDRLYVRIHNDEPVFLGATDFEAELLEVPPLVTLSLPEGEDGLTNGISLAASEPIDEINLRAHSENRPYPTVPAGEAGAILDSTGGEMALAVRVYKLQEIEVSLDPLELRTKMEGGRKFIVDAAIEDEDTAAVTEVDAVIDELPAEVTVGLQDNIVDGEPNGSKLSMVGSAPINLLSLETKGLELLEGASHIKAEIEKVPQALIVTLPDTGALAQIVAQDGANQPTDIGQLRLAAATGTATLPADTYNLATNTSTGDDLLNFVNTPANVDIAARISGVKSLGLNLDPIALSASLLGGKKLSIDATVANKDEEGVPTGTNTELDALIDALPSTLNLSLEDGLPEAGGGTRLAWAGSTAINQITLSASGIELLEGADSLAADIRGVPAGFSVALPDTDTYPGFPLADLNVTGATQAAGGPRINELRLAAGGVTLSSPGMAAGGAQDQFRYNGNPASFGVGVKLTGIKGLEMNLDPIALTIEQEASLTKPIAINATLPQEAPLPDSTITGLMNKPTAKTVVGVTLVPGQPTSLNLQNGHGLTAVNSPDNTMGSLSLNMANLGSIPAASFSLSNVPHKLVACLTTDGACIRTDSAHLTSAYATWQPSNNCSTKPQVPGNFPASPAPQFPNGRRPYNPMVSMYFDDLGTSVQPGGPNSTANRNIANMITMNADITLAVGDPHVIINNLRFHNLSLDFADSGTSFTFKPLASISAGSVPRIYIYLDSQKLPFVMNDVRYPPQLPKMVMGTDGNPARAFKRISWVPGSVTGSLGTFLGCGASQAINTQSQNGLDCGGAKELQMQTSLGTLNAFNLPIFGDVLNICGGTVPTT